MPQTLQDFALGTRLAASSGVAKRAFSFSPQWSGTGAIKKRTQNRLPMPRRLSALCMASEACMYSTDYLVICGRASARPMDAACPTLESPLDSSKHIIAQLLCPVQHSLMQGFLLSASCCPSLAQLESSDAPKIRNGHAAMRCNRCDPIPNACRQALSEQADSILETVNALVGLIAATSMRRGSRPRRRSKCHQRVWH